MCVCVCKKKMKKQSISRNTQNPSGINELIQSQLHLLSSHPAVGFELQQVVFATSTCIKYIADIWLAH